MRQVVTILVLSGMVAACPKPLPATFITSQGNLVMDYTGRASTEDVECVADVFLDKMPLAREHLPLLSVTFKPDRIKFSRCEERADSGKCVTRKSRTARGVYWCKDNYTHIMFQEGNCLAGTALVHEMLHFSRERLMGDCDARHEDEAWWGEDGMGGFWLEIYTEAVAKCCL